MLKITTFLVCLCLFILVSHISAQNPAAQIDLEKQMELDEFSKSGRRAIDILGQDKYDSKALPPRETMQ